MSNIPTVATELASPVFSPAELAVVPGVGVVVVVEVAPMVEVGAAPVVVLVAVPLLVAVEDGGPAFSTGSTGRSGYLAAMSLFNLACQTSSCKGYCCNRDSLWESSFFISCRRCYGRRGVR